MRIFLTLTDDLSVNIAIVRIAFAVKIAMRIVGLKAWSR